MFMVLLCLEMCALEKGLCVCVCVCVCTCVLSLLFMKFSRQEYWSGLPFPSPGHLLNIGVKMKSLASPASAGSFSTTAPPGEFQRIYK